MTDDKRPTPSDVEAHINQLETDAWNIEDYNTSYGEYDDYTVTVELSWREPTPEGFRELKTLIENIEGQYDEGAPVEAVVESAITEFDVSRQKVQDGIETLKETGEVYQPNQDTLRTI